MTSLWFIEKQCPECGHVVKTLVAKTSQSFEPILRATPENDICDWEAFKAQIVAAGSVVRQGKALYSAERFCSLMLHNKKIGKDASIGLIDSFRDVDGWLFCSRDFA